MLTSRPEARETTCRVCGWRWTFNVTSPWSRNCSECVKRAHTLRRATRKPKKGRARPPLERVVGDQLDVLQHTAAQEARIQRALTASICKRCLGVAYSGVCEECRLDDIGVARMVATMRGEK